MDDESNHGNDETRLLVLTNLSNAKCSQFPCCLCTRSMYVYDKYPLIDGTFFLTPKQHNSYLMPVSALFLFSLILFLQHCFSIILRVPTPVNRNSTHETIHRY